MFIGRLFQHYHGEVPLPGIVFSELKVIESGGAPLIIWLREGGGNVWYRIFIDGICCAVDKFENEDYRSDFDEDEVVLKDFSDQIMGRKLLKAIVSEDRNGNEISLILEFHDNSSIVFTSDNEGVCTLSFSNE